MNGVFPSTNIDRARAGSLTVATSRPEKQGGKQDYDPSSRAVQAY